MSYTSATGDKHAKYQAKTSFSSDFVPAVEINPLLAEPFLVITQQQPVAKRYAQAQSNPVIDLQTMAFIGNIPTSVSDYAIEQLLWCCGPVRRYKRVYDYNGNLKKWAFCVFEDGPSLIRCMHVVGGEDVQVPELKGGVQLYPLEGASMTVVIDPIARFFLKNIKDPNPIEEDLAVFEKMKPLLKDIKISDNDEYVVGIRKQIASKNKPIEEEDEDRPAARPVKEFTVDEIQEDKRRQEKREQERRLEFQEREKRYEAHESTRIKRILMDIDQDQAIERRQKYSMEILPNRLAEFDDDKERELGKEDYFYDKDRWYNQRQRDLKKEEELDDRDRRIANEERERALKEQLQRKEQEERERLEKLEKEKSSESAQTVHVPIHIPQPEGFVVTKIMTKEERMKEIQDLIEQIPVQKEELWQWPVKWEFMSESVLIKKIKPFLSKKIVEMVGAEEADLVDFVVDQIRTSAEPIVLDDETETFVSKLWRMVIYETESIAKGL